MDTCLKRKKHSHFVGFLCKEVSHLLPNCVRRRRKKMCLDWVKAADMHLKPL
jgi:hypothetical protein